MVCLTTRSIYFLINVDGLFYIHCIVFFSICMKTLLSNYNKWQNNLNKNYHLRFCVTQITSSASTQVIDRKYTSLGFVLSSTINLSMEHLKWHQMLRQMQKRSLRRTIVACACSQRDTKRTVFWLVQMTLCIITLSNVPAILLNQTPF